MGRILIASGNLTGNSLELPFTNVGLPGYELLLRNIWPNLSVLTPAYATYPNWARPCWKGVWLFLHLSKDNGATYDAKCCQDGPTSGCGQHGHYSFANTYTIAGDSNIYTRNSGMGMSFPSPPPANYTTEQVLAYNCARNDGIPMTSTEEQKWDEEFEIAYQGVARTTLPHQRGLSGRIRFFNPLADGLYKQVQWDTSYFTYHRNPKEFDGERFCRETGAGFYVGRTTEARTTPDPYTSPSGGIPHSGDGISVNKFRLLYTTFNGFFGTPSDPGIDTSTNNPVQSPPFGGGSYSFWAID